MSEPCRSTVSLGGVTIVCQQGGLNPYHEQRSGPPPDYTLRAVHGAWVGQVRVEWPS